MESYVQLLTCLELQHDVAKQPRTTGGRPRCDPSSLPRQAIGRYARSSRASLTCAFHCDMLSAMIFTEVIATWLSCA